MIKDLSLKAIRQQIMSGMRDVTFTTDDGGTTQMVYIPKFTVPAGAYDGGTFPAEDLHLGGFFIDNCATAPVGEMLKVALVGGTGGGGDDEGDGNEGVTPGGEID